MNKFVYWCGVYFICITIHDVMDIAWMDYQKHKDKQEKNPESKSKNKGPIGVQAEPARKPTGKIGFAIPEN